MKHLATHNHIVPAFYLRHWMGDEGEVIMVLAETGEERPVPIRHAGVREGIYLRERPTGEKVDDIERISLANTEADAAPISVRC